MKKQENKTIQWIKFILVLIAWLLFCYWLESWLGLIVVPFIYDAYISKKINWGWWKERENPLRFIMSWVDAIVFALVAVYFINQFFFQNYYIPSSSLEKSLLKGDYLFVSKVSYGPRIPQTPLTMPLTQHTMFWGMKSYIEWPQWDYRRAKGLGEIELNDIVVFNFPANDTVCMAPDYQGHDYYQLCYQHGYQCYPQQIDVDNLSDEDRMRYFDIIYNTGRQVIRLNAHKFGEVDTRPVDRRENYVKRCVGLPGQTLQIKDRIIYLDGKANKEPDNVQYSYIVKRKQHLPEELIEELQLSDESLTYLNQFGYMPLTKHAVEVLRKRTDIVESVTLVTDASERETYPLNGNMHWTRDNYGPVWIPKKGESIDLTLDNIAIYERPIKVYEGNDLQVKDGKIYINGKETKSYTFKMDYYWMMGDNRHNSADSRYWGFVPEDHIVGKPIFIWWSKNPDHGLFSGIRWNRLFTFVDDIK